jgi:hypothetical protein
VGGTYVLYCTVVHPNSIRIKHRSFIGVPPSVCTAAGYFAPIKNFLIVFGNEWVLIRFRIQDMWEYTAADCVSME